ncbi:MAG TPA: rhamnulokinase [Clostridiaceae bacterium]|nr:rhamnulokinase [Clostridiaceae bacterium]
MKIHRALAFDIGASSGRAILGEFDGDRITLSEIHRFSNDPVLLQGTLYWDVLRLFHEIRQGLLTAKHDGAVDSIGIDTWGVDFGLLDRDGRLLENPIHYRDRRTETVLADFEAVMPTAELYRRTGIQMMPINTIFQLYSLVLSRPELLERTATALLMPDLLAYFLTGEMGSEYTIASTTGLLDPHKRQWDRALFQKAGLKPDLFPDVVMPGTQAGALSAEIQQELSVPAIPVYRVTSHDTASAVLAVPADHDDFIYISSGTWSLMGIETAKPMLDEDSVKIGYTNEGGYGGKIRYLKNIMGLWLIQESRRQWIREGKNLSYADMERLALEKPAFVSLVDPDDARFTAPGDLPNRIREICKETNQPIPKDEGEVVRVIYESLALKYRAVKETLEKVTQRDFAQIHVVGGGTKDGLLSQFTANATNATVVAGPIEATAMGNVAVQLLAEKRLENVQAVRHVVANSFNTLTYEPKETAAWDSAYARYKKLFGEHHE